jgi:phage I-like protein
VEVPVIDGKPPPREFRIFRAGVNPTDKGLIVFNDAAAARVMSIYGERGNRVVIDLEHDSVNPEARARRNDAADAMGRCDFELRPGPELWAVNTDWTPEGVDRLCTRKSQDSISPVVFFDKETREITEIFNLALVSQPAMHSAPTLVAGRNSGDLSMDPAIIKAALEALIAGDATAALDVLKNLVTEAAGGAEELAPDTDTEDAASEAADPMSSDMDPESEEKKDEEAAAASALSVALSSALGVQTPGAILAEVRKLQSQVDALQLARAADEHAERVALVGELVKLGAELPATAWADPDAKVLHKDLADKPIAALRQRVEAFRAAPRAFEVSAPRRAVLDVAALSASEQSAAEAITDDAARARFVAMRLAKKGGSQ